ncbi:MAG TPA: hypothetical protein VJJ75_01350 [Candidatus Nanoarchaeia archaeon]|nr:hypothetical protein [Candidatus Nanoarchaeia archaeon]
MYELFDTPEFAKIEENADGSERIWIHKIKKKLAQDVSGKILHFSCIREKKFLNKRLYFIADETTKRILLITFKEKKK